MAKATGFSNCFNAGELSPDADARSDLQQYANGLAMARNCNGLVAGPQAKRNGFWYIGVPGDYTRWVPFARTVDDAYALEFGPGAFYVWRADGTRVMSGIEQVHVAHGLEPSQIAGLMWEQNGDVMWFTTAEGTRTKRLKRLAADNWVFGDVDFRQGPFRPENADALITLQIASGPVTAGTTGAPLVASSPAFVPGHVGALYRLRLSGGASATKAWAPGASWAANEACSFNGRTYVAPLAATSGNNPPVHEESSMSDGGMQWDYHDDGAGVVRVTGYTDATHVTVEILATLPYALNNQTTPAWSEGAFSDYRGYPTAKPAVREERLILAAAPDAPDTFDATRTAGFNGDAADFKPGLGSGAVLDDDAIRRFAGDTPGRIQWLMSAAFLMAGLTSGEVVITGATLDDPLSPASTVARSVGDDGSDRVAPVKAQGSILFVQRGGETLRELRVEPDQPRGNRDLSVLADHISGRGIAEIAWSGSSNILWLRMADGGLASLTYHAEHGVFGWNSHELSEGGFSVDSLMVLPAPDGGDRLWLHVHRQKGGETQRLLLLQAPARDGLHYDAAEYYAGAPASGVSGLDHLEGETVSVMADGSEYLNLTVTGGAVTLPDGETAQEIWAGLPFRFRCESLPLDLAGPGTGQAARKTLTQGLVVLEGVTARVGVAGAANLDRVVQRRAADATPVVRRMSEQVTFNADTDRDQRVVVEDTSGYPLKLKAIKPSMTANP